MARNTESCPGDHEFCACELAAQDRIFALEAALARAEAVVQTFDRWVDRLGGGDTYAQLCEAMASLYVALHETTATRAGADAGDG